MTYKKSVKYVLVVLMIALLTLSIALVACNGNGTPPSNPTDPSGGSQGGGSQSGGSQGGGSQGGGSQSGGSQGEPSKKDITGVTFESKTFTYDGQQHELTVSGDVPSDVTVTYTGNKGTDAGIYNAKATLSGEGYNSKELTATLTINKAEWDYSAITFDGDIVEYDAKEHSLQIVGNVPSGITVTYLYDGEEVSGVTAVGTHEVVAVMSGKNHVEHRLSATLKIISTEEMLYTIYHDGNVYFQNNLDGNKLYKVSASGAVSKVSNDVAQYFCKADGKLYFYSGSLFTQTIKQLSGTTVDSKYFPGRATYLASDGTNVYYAKTNLIDTKHENGIYKVNLSEENAEAVRICTDKASDLVYWNGYIYYINTSEGDKLYKVSVTANDGTGSLVHDKKISDLVVDDGYAYFTQHENATAAIFRLDLTGGEAVKMTTDNGAYITKVGNYLYYVNKDMLTSNIFGKGIYCVSINASGNLTSQKILEAENGDGYYSLTSDGTNLYYYRRNDKHLYRYNVNSQAETDLMRNFQAPEEQPVFAASPYSFVAEHDGEIYYANPLDFGALYKFNPTTKLNVKMLSESVSNVYFNGDYMYYSTYILTNYALWRINITTSNAEPEKISSHRYENLIFQGNYLYATRIGIAGSHDNHIVKFDLNDLSAEEIQLYNDKNVHITKLYLLNDKFYFCINPAIGYKYIYTHDLNGELTQSVNTNLYSDNFVIVNDKFYYYNHRDNNLSAANIDGTGINILTSNVEITDIVAFGNTVYYTSTSSKNTGIFAYNTVTGATTKLTDKVGHGLTVLNGKLYFINLSVTYDLDYPQKGSGDGHLYCVDVAGGTATKLA